MSDMITPQQLADASLDAQALATTVNGDENTTVTTRLGETYPTIKKTIADIFERGGLPATPFKTKALMTASALVDGNYAMVIDDTVNNGLYVKTSGTWVKSDYDPAKQANVYTDSVAISTLDTASQAANVSIDIAVEEVVRNQEKTVSSSADGARLFVFVDDGGKVVEYTDSNGGKHLTDMEGSLQSNIHKANQVAEAVIVNKSNNATHIFSDSNDRVLAYIRANGGLMLQGLDVAVQDKITGLEAQVKDLTEILYSNSVAKVPERVKGDFSVATADLLNLVVDKPYTSLVMDSPYRKDDFFIHPDVISLSEPMRGYNYLMCNTPYKDYNIMEENPVIYGSKDRIKWEMLTGFDQPLANPPDIDSPWEARNGFLSDNWLSYDPIRKELLLGWRKNYYADKSQGYQLTDTTELWYRKTTNGIHWSEPIQLFKPTLMGTDDLVSPNLIYDKVNNRWVLFTSGKVRFNPTLNPDTWSDFQYIGISDFGGLVGWHYGTGFVGDKLVMIIGDSAGGSTGGQKTYRLAVSNDDTFLNWSFTLNSVFGTTWNGAYKGSFLVIPVDDTHIKIQFFVAGGNPGRVRTLTSDLINITQTGAA